jgi:predicted AAA+ superfamily ATPase
VFEPGPLTLAPSPSTKAAILERALTGGYPELIGRGEARRRRAWFHAYTTKTLQRDVRDLANIDALDELPRLLRAVAARAGSLINVARLSADMGIPQTTVKRYVALLQATFLVEPVPSWSGGLDGRLFRAPRVMLNDSGLLAYLVGATTARFDADATRSGAVLENFVVAELRKQMAWAEEPAGVFFFRTHGGVEVDVVLERADGAVVGIEVKASSSPQPSDLRGLEHLRDRLGARFVRGVLLHTGTQTLPFGDRLTAMPVDALWRLGAVATS